MVCIPVWHKCLSQELQYHMVWCLQPSSLHVHLLGALEWIMMCIDNEMMMNDCL